MRRSVVLLAAVVAVLTAAAPALGAANGSSEAARTSFEPLDSLMSLRQSATRAGACAADAVKNAD